MCQYPCWKAHQCYRAVYIHQIEIIDVFCFQLLDQHLVSLWGEKKKKKRIKKKKKRKKNKKKEMAVKYMCSQGEMQKTKILVALRSSYSILVLVGQIFFLSVSFFFLLCSWYASNLNRVLQDHPFH